MDYCGPHGIPHSRFLSWPEDDQQKALWWQDRDRRRCSGCGTHPDDWNEDVGGSRRAFVAEERTCPGCRERGPADDALSQERSRNAAAKYGTRVVLVRPKEDPEGGD